MPVRNGKLFEITQCVARNWLQRCCPAALFASISTSTDSRLLGLLRAHVDRLQPAARSGRPGFGQTMAQNTKSPVGVNRRRGDGTFGELVPAAEAISQEGFVVARGPVATIEVGAETKILAKAMIKQIDRVVGDLIRQTGEFRKHSGNPICIGLVGVNSAEQYTSFEGPRTYSTDGRKEKHPKQEAEEAISRLEHRARPSFNEFLILRFNATNVPPFPFTWVHERHTVMEYSALLTRVSREYDRRFG
jgi:hypothetical protein